METSVSPFVGSCRSRALDFNFPRRIGTGISQRLAPCKTSKDGIKYINECCIYDPDERYVHCICLVCGTI